MPNQAYRLRVRNAGDTADDFIITSIRGGENPYIASVPTGDGQEVDLLTGAVRTGAYVVEVADAVTGSDFTGTLRIITNKLYDGSTVSSRPHLLSRKAFIELSTDGGANWPTVWIAGYLTSVRQIDAIRYSFTVSNTRRVEQTKQVFTWSTNDERAKFPQRGCVFGGPIIDGFGVGGDKTIDSRGWEFKLLGSSGSLSTPKQGDVLSLSYQAGYFAPGWERKTKPGPDQAVNFWNNILPYREMVPGDASLAGSIFNQLNDSNVVPAYPRLVAVVSYSVGGTEYTVYGSIRCFFNVTYNPAVNNNQPRWAFIEQYRLFVTLDAPDPNNTSTPWPALPAADTIVRVRAVSREVDETSPLYIDLHPVEVAKRLYQLIGITVDATSVTNVTAALGVNTRVAMRITKPQTMAEFLESAIYGPFGFASRINASNELEFFTTRKLNAVAPSYTIADADVVGDTPPAVYDLDEGTVVTGFVVEQQTFHTWAEVDENTTTPPADGIYVVTQPVELLTGDTTTYSTRIVEYKVPGMVHEVSSFVPDLQNFALSIAREGFDRFGRGAPAMDIQVLRTSSAAAAQIGDLVYLNVSYFPNRNYRIGESSVGARVAQVVRREERPEGPIFKLVDAGTYNQPAVAPTITIAASTRDVRRIAAFTITNANVLNSAGDVTVAIEWATGASAPTGNGTSFVRYSPNNIPTIAQPLPAVTPGSKVHVRARTEQPGLFPSAWTAWQTVTLTAWVDPTSVSVATITNESAVVSWSLNTNTTDAVDVFVAPGSVAPSNWQAYRINTLPAGTTATTLTNLTASTAYIVGVAFRDVVSGTRATVVTTTFSTTSSTSGVASRPAGFTIIDGVADASLPQGVVLGLYSAVGADSIVIERAPNLTNVGAGLPDYPGTYAVIAVVPATTTTYTDYLPRNGTKYWYRIKHTRSGQADSAYIPQFFSVAAGNVNVAGLLAVATGIPSTITRSPGTDPLITPESLYIDSGPFLKEAVVRLNYYDPQNRAMFIQFRTRQRIKKVWGAWDETYWTTEGYKAPPNSSPLNLTSGFFQPAVTLANTSYIYQLEWRLYGSDAQGNLSYIRSGVTEWPLNYGVNNPLIKIQKQGFNSTTNKYEVWWRYYFQRGNNTLDEDGEDNTGQTFTTQIIAATVKNQDGTTATGVTTSGSKTADGWYGYWNSSATDNWTYEISVDTALPTEYYLQYQDTNNLEQELFAPTFGQTFIGPASQTAAGAVDWSDITNIPTSVESLIEVVWGTPSAESSNAIEVQGVCYDINNAVYTTNMVYATVVVTDGAADAEPSSTATIDAASTPVGTVVAGAGTATAVFKTNASGQFKIKVTETAAASRYIWVRSGGHQQVYVRARDGILQLIYS